ncbi:MAG TPA: DUF6662 family protein [Sphingomicrobium sp.]|nr:DUF6662 family protein [Sphingomicrobium sp.]
MRPFAAAGLLAGLAFVHPQAAAASPDLGYVYTAGIEEPGETELTLWATDRRGKGEGHYDAQDYRLEVERGITERFQLSGYANFAGHHIRGVSGELEPVRRDLGFQGLSAEFKYQLRTPTDGRVGLALYAEPGWSRIAKVTGEKAPEYELEVKAIVQKNFLADRLVWAANLTFEPEWEREREEIAPGVVSSHMEKELAIETATGLTYRVAPNWWVGAEARYHSAYPDWTQGLHRENYAVYAGPSVHFDADEWAVTATWLPQLFGGPGRAGSSLEFDDHERRELRLKISHEF